ncbi:mCG144778, partial [Mus musculus]
QALAHTCTDDQFSLLCLESLDVTSFLLCLKVWKVFWTRKIQGCVRSCLIVLPEDPSIPLLGIYPEDVPTCKKDTCSTMFIAALFIIARSWKEPICPSTEEWIQKMWYIYTMEYYSAIKKNEFMKFLGKWMDLEGIILSEVTQSQKNSHVMYSLISGF